MKIKESQLRQIIRESIQEISNQLVGSAIKKGQDIGRYNQTRNIIDMKCQSINDKYAFNVQLDNGNNCKFTINYTDNRKFFIWVNYNGNHFALKPYMNHFKYIDNNYFVSQTPIGFVIDNLKAGQRMKLKQLANAVKELNGEQQQEQLQESAIPSQYAKYSMQLMQPIMHNNIHEFIQIFNSFTPEIKNAVYHYFADTNRIKPEFIQTMKQNI